MVRSIFLALVGFAVAGNALAGSVTLTPVGPLLAPGSFSFGSSINNIGEVAGAATISTPRGQVSDAFIWDSATGVYQALGALPEGFANRGVNATPAALNDIGQMAGTMYALPPGSANAAYFWSAGATQAVPALDHQLYSQALAINNAGVVVGSMTAGGRFDPYLPFLFDGSTTRALALPDGFTSGVAKGVNSAGQVIGVIQSSIGQGPTHAALWDGDRVTEIDTGDDAASPVGIDDAGRVYVNSCGAAGCEVFAWQGGIRSDLFSFARGSATAVNNLGQVVGNYYAAGGHLHMFMWSATTGFVDLSDLVDPGLNWLPEEGGLRDINDLGQMVGYGINPNGTDQAFILSLSSADAGPAPAGVDEPSTVLLALLALFAIVDRRRAASTPSA